MNNYFSFVGGNDGAWQVTSNRAIIGEPLESVQMIDMINLPAVELKIDSVWVLQGFISNLRYTERAEVTQLRAKQEGLSRPNCMCAAMIPIKKNAEWWAMAQDERRAIFEEQSHHTGIGLGYLPEIARQLHHSRDLGELFDFITWFEFAPEHTVMFDKLLLQLRSSKEWQYVEREIDIRLQKCLTPL
jgi:chlorite dismutase